MSRVAALEIAEGTLGLLASSLPFRTSQTTTPTTIASATEAPIRAQPEPATVRTG